MAQKDAKTIKDELARPFAPEDLEWRIQYANEKTNRGIVVPYVTNRAIQARLDEVVGIAGWYNDYKPWHGANKKEAQICGISIYFEERSGFITKWDGAEDSDIEPVKGGLSDSMKRAAVQWGIGRVLYSMTDPVWVDIEPRGRSWAIQKKERPVMDSAYLSLLNTLKLQPAAPIGRPCAAAGRWKAGACLRLHRAGSGAAKGHERQQHRGLPGVPGEEAGQRLCPRRTPAACARRDAFRRQAGQAAARHRGILCTGGVSDRECTAGGIAEKGDDCEKD